MDLNDLIHYPFTFGLLIANIILSLIGFNNRGFINKMIMWPYGVKHNNQYYRFITSGFVHANYLHLFFNMFTLFFFGRVVETELTVFGLGGNISYMALYFGGLIVSDIPSYIKHKENSDYLSLGASGAVSAIVFASIVFAPWSSIGLYGFINIPAIIYAVLYVIYCAYMSRKGAGHINHDAHLWGSLFGLLFIIAITAEIRPELFTFFIEQLKHPGLFGNQ